MAKKASKKYVVHHKLEQPVHNVVGYLVLLALVVVVFYVIMQLKGFGVV